MVSGAIVSGAILSGAIVSGAIVSGAIVSGAIASGAIVSGAIVGGAIVSGAIVSRGTCAWSLSKSMAMPSKKKPKSNVERSSGCETGELPASCCELTWRGRE